MTLIVGATGLLGSQICSLLATRGQAVRALVRSTANPDRIAFLHGLGAEIVVGDLKDPRSLETACRGIDTVISTASSTLSRQEGDSIETVDRQGQLALVNAAETAGVRHFVFISFPSVAIDFQLQSAKREVEGRLQRGRMTYTILQPTFFMEVWLSPAVGFDVVNATAQIYGSGQPGISWISLEDVARFAVASLDNPRAANAVVKLGGPEALSPLDAVALAEKATGKKFVVQHVSEDDLRKQHGAATDSLQRSFAGLMLYYASGDVIDSADALERLPIERRKSVHEHLREAARGVGQSV